MAKKFFLLRCDEGLGRGDAARDAEGVVAGSPDIARGVEPGSDEVFPGSLFLGGLFAQPLDALEAVE